MAGGRGVNLEKISGLFEVLPIYEKRDHETPQLRIDNEHSPLESKRMGNVRDTEYSEIQ